MLLDQDLVRVSLNRKEAKRPLERVSLPRLADGWCSRDPLQESQRRALSQESSRRLAVRSLDPLRSPPPFLVSDYLSRFSIPLCFTSLTTLLDSVPLLFLRQSLIDSSHSRAVSRLIHSSSLAYFSFLFDSAAARATPPSRSRLRALSLARAPL